MTAPVLAPTPSALSDAAAALRRGGLVGMPTETVYGLAADAANGEAVARIYGAKGRPRFNPLIAHGASVEAARAEVRWTESAELLASRFWPGPLTLVLPVRPGGQVSDLARAGLDTLAVRVPAHPVALGLIEAFGAPVVAPSANPSGRISPTAAADVATELGDAVELVLDGGPSRVGLESTIVSLVGQDPALLRPGGLDPRAIEEVLGAPLRWRRDDPDAPTSPGQLLRHYAPAAELRLEAVDQRPGEAYLAFGATPEGVVETASLSPDGDLTEAASRLFSVLRALDREHALIAVAPVPEVGLGVAINDRLRRAATR